MPEISEPRVAVYLDFDNIVISRYDQVHGRGHFMRDRGRFADARKRSLGPGLRRVSGRMAFVFRRFLQKRISTRQLSGSGSRGMTSPRRRPIRSAVALIRGTQPP